MARDFDEMRRLVGQDVLPNTFIGGIGGVITTKEMLASTLGISSANIQNFEILSNNISCFITNSYNPTVYAFSTTLNPWPYGAIMTYFMDINGLCQYIPNYTFSGQPLVAVIIPGLLNQDRRALNGCHFKYLYNKECTIVSGASDHFRGNEPYLKRIFLPKCTAYGANNFNNSVFRCPSLTHIYVHPSMMTILSGGLEGDLAYAQTNYGTNIIPVTDFTPPGNITNLSVGTITSTTAVLNFTPPSSLNGMSFYEVWLDDGTNNPVQKYYPSGKEITASGQTVTGLVSGTTYKLKIAACDIFWNGSGMSDEPAFSNQITFTTL